MLEHIHNDKTAVINSKGFQWWRWQWDLPCPRREDLVWCPLSWVVIEIDGKGEKYGSSGERSCLVLKAAG